METSLNQNLKDKFQELKFISDLKNDDQISQILLFFHSVNVSNNMKCTGLQEDDPEGEYDLPPNWNVLQGGVCSFRYKSENGENIYFKYIIFNQNVNINCAYKENLYSLQIKISDIDLENLDSEKTQQFLKNYQEKILKNLDLKPKKQEQQQQSQSRQQNFNDPLRVDRPQPQHNPLRVGGPFGNNDLDPFGDPRLGGNLMGPNNPQFGGHGQGGLRAPPGARFDPLNPQGGFQGNEPDNDMFMPQGGFGNNRGGFGRGGFGGGGFGGGMGGGFGGNQFM